MSGLIILFLLSSIEEDDVKAEVFTVVVPKGFCSFGLRSLDKFAVYFLVPRLELIVKSVAVKGSVSEERSRTIGLPGTPLLFCFLG